MSKDTNVGRVSFSEGYSVQKGSVGTLSQPSGTTAIHGGMPSHPSPVRHELTDGFLALLLAVIIITGTVFVIMCTVWGVVRGGRRTEQKQKEQVSAGERASFVKEEAWGPSEHAAPPTEDTSRASEEEEAYQAVGRFWAHWYEETGDPLTPKLLQRLVLKQRDAAFSCLYDMVVDAPIAERHCVLSALSEGKTQNSWRAFQKCSTTVEATLRIWARLKANKEAAEQRRAREEAQQRQKEQTHAESSVASDKQQESWHEVLGVAPQATLEDITLAYRCLMKKHHPDRFVHIGGQVYEEAVQMTQQITWAFHYVKQERKSGDAGLNEI